MDTSSDDYNTLRIRLAVTEEKQKHIQEIATRQDKELKEAYITLGRRVSELEQTKDELNKTKTLLEVTKQKLTHTEKLLNQRSKNVSQKNKNTKYQISLVSILFLLSSLLASFGTNMLTSTPPSSLGYVMIAAGIATYLIATLLTALFSSEGSNQ